MKANILYKSNATNKQNVTEFIDTLPEKLEHHSNNTVHKHHNRHKKVSVLLNCYNFPSAFLFWGEKSTMTDISLFLGRDTYPPSVRSRPYFKQNLNQLHRGSYVKQNLNQLHRGSYVKHNLNQLRRGSYVKQNLNQLRGGSYLTQSPHHTSIGGPYVMLSFHQRRKNRTLREASVSFVEEHMSRRYSISLAKYNTLRRTSISFTEDHILRKASISLAKDHMLRKTSINFAKDHRLRKASTSFVEDHTSLRKASTSFTENRTLHKASTSFADDHALCECLRVNAREQQKRAGGSCLLLRER